MSMIMSSVPVVVIVSVAVMCVTEGYKAYDINDEPEDRDDQKLIEALEFMTFPESFKCIEYDLHTDEPGSG
jgi:hypothetical protein